MKGRWRNIKDEKPEIAQECMIRYKHGFISAQYSPDVKHENDMVFFTYIWRDQTMNGYFWMPIEEFKELTDYKEF